jgi:hypothetical protein
MAKNELEKLNERIKQIQPPPAYIPPRPPSPPPPPPPKEYDSGTFISYLYDSNPIKDAGAMHGISLYSFGRKKYWAGWYFSFRANTEFFQTKYINPPDGALRITGEQTSSFALSAGIILKPLPYISLALGGGAGSHVQTYTYDEKHAVINDDSRSWHGFPEAALLLNLRSVILSAGVKYCQPAADNSSSPFLFSGGVGLNLGTSPEEYRRDYYIPFFSYVLDLPNPTSADFGIETNWVGFSGGIFESGGIFKLGEIPRLGYYGSLRTNWPYISSFFYENAETNLNKNDSNVKNANFLLTGGLNYRLMHPLYLSLGGGVWYQRLIDLDAKQKQSYGTYSFAPEAGVHIAIGYLLFSLVATVPKCEIRYDNIYYSLGIGVLFPQDR